MSNITLTQALEIGLRHHNAGELQQAESAYRQVIAQHPEQPNALYLLGVLAHQTGSSNVAIELIERAIGAHPIAEFYVTLGYVLRTMGRMGEAIEACGCAVRLAPNSSEAHN